MVENQAAVRHTLGNVLHMQAPSTSMVHRLLGRRLLVQGKGKLRDGSAFEGT